MYRTRHFKCASRFVDRNILNETLGEGWICHSFLPTDLKGYYPQVLHIDQSPLSPWITEEAPALVNTLYIPQDVNEVNGGTLIIPGAIRTLLKRVVMVR